MSDELYHCCRWCKWFENGQCLNVKAFDPENFEFYPFYEDGALSEAIREGFKEFKFVQLEHALIESKLSKKRVREIMEIFIGELELDAQLIWTETIDECVSTALEYFDFGTETGVKITNPHEFYCKYFL